MENLDEVSFPQYETIPECPKPVKKDVSSIKTDKCLEYTSFWHYFAAILGRIMDFML